MRKLLLELADSFREVFIGIRSWTALCGFSLIPGFGTIVGIIIVNVVNLVLRALSLDPLADWLCQSLSDELTFTKQLETVPLDIIKIWMFSYILISVISFVSWLPYRKNSN